MHSQVIGECMPFTRVSHDVYNLVASITIREEPSMILIFGCETYASKILDLLAAKQSRPTSLMVILIHWESYNNVNPVFLTLCERFLPPNCQARSHQSKAAHAQPLWHLQTPSNPIAPLVVIVVLLYVDYYPKLEKKPILILFISLAYPTRCMSDSTIYYY